MRVVLLAAAGPWSGVEVHTIQLASALKAWGHDAVIVELGSRGYAEAHVPLPCQVIHLNLGSSSTADVPLDYVGFITWTRMFGSLQADVAISIKGTFKFASLAMEAAARLRFQRFLVIEHLHSPLPRRQTGQYFGGRVSGLGLWWFRAKLSGFLRSVFPERVLCVSHAVARTLQEDYSYPRAKLQVVQNGVDTDRFAPNPRFRDLARTTWGISEAAFVFGTIGRLSPMKNHSQLIHAFSQLRHGANGRDVRLVIIGEGPLRYSIEKLVHSKGMGEYVVFGGFSTNPERLYQAFDVFCIPSASGEALLIALLEAKASGCPPIASAVGDMPEVVKDSQQGWLIPSGDENALLSAMRHAMMLANGERAKLGLSARESVVRNFNVVDRMDKLVGAIEAAYSA